MRRLLQVKGGDRASAAALVILALAVVVVQGCGTVRARQPVPPAYLDEAPGGWHA